MVGIQNTKYDLTALGAEDGSGRDRPEEASAEAEKRIQANT